LSIPAVKIKQGVAGDSVSDEPGKGRIALAGASRDVRLGDVGA